MVTRCIWCGNKLPKGRRKYCSEDCAYLYFQKYKAPLWWSNAREMALRRTSYRCEVCGSKSDLQIHHKVLLEAGEPRDNSPKNEQSNLQVLCRSCHEKAHHSQNTIETHRVPNGQLALCFEATKDKIRKQ